MPILEVKCKEVSSQVVSSSTNQPKNLPKLEKYYLQVMILLSCMMMSLLLLDMKTTKESIIPLILPIQLKFNPNQSTFSLVHKRTQKMSISHREKNLALSVILNQKNYLRSKSKILSFAQNAVNISQIKFSFHLHKEKRDHIRIQITWRFVQIRFKNSPERILLLTELIFWTVNENLWVSFQLCFIFDLLIELHLCFLIIYYSFSLPFS